jgi:hypothetical protein
MGWLSFFNFVPESWKKILRNLNGISNEIRMLIVETFVVFLEKVG